MTEDQTKLACYWNTPFNKICLGMKVDNTKRWIVVNYTASSLYDVIVSGTFKATKVGRKSWESLIVGSVLQNNCNQEGFNLRMANKLWSKSISYMNIRIGLVANDQNDCDSCNSCLGFGTSVHGCYEKFPRKTTCGNLGVCGKLDDKNTAAFGYILVQ